MRSTPAALDRIYKIQTIGVSILFRLLIAVLFSSFFGDGAAAFQTSGPAPLSPMTEEVMGRFHRVPVGGGTLGDFNYPDDYVRRIADRVVRSSFEQRFRVVAPDYRPTGQPALTADDFLRHKPDQSSSLVVILGVGLALIVITGAAARRLSRRARR